MLAPLAALTLALSPLAAQELAGMAGLSESLAGLRFTRAPAAAESAAPASAAGVPVTAPDVSAYSVRGLDVSAWQGVIDWDQVAKAGASFAYIKATEGAGLVDEQFKRNWAEAKKAGLLRGAYHFWDFCGSGAAQAARFIQTVPADEAALPMTIDLEESRPCRMPSKDAFQKSLGVFLAKVESAYGLKPVLYVNLSIYQKYLAGADHGLRIWIADPRDASPNMPAGVDWAMWQYSWNGTLPGIDDNKVDLDVFNGTTEQLAALTRPSPVMFASR